MTYPIRRAHLGDMPAIALQDGASFGFQFTGDELAEALTILDPQRFFVATDGDRIVGVTGDYAMTMATPGGSLDVPGVTWVSVNPTHRRRGILRQLMHHQLRAFADAGVAAAILTASEGGIYGRFGYGAASQVRKLAIERQRAVLRSSEDGGAVLLATPAEARAAMPDIHERWRRTIPGALARTAARWDVHLRDREAHRDGMSGLYFLLHRDGYVAYRAGSNWNDGRPGHNCRIIEYATATPQAHAALWRVLLGLDLFGTIESDQIPVDDPLPYLLTDQRQVRSLAVNDGLWIRPIDVGALVRARCYGLEFEVVWEISDELFGAGRYLIRGGPDGGTCERTDATAQLASGVDVLGAVYLGGHRLQALATAGRVGYDDAALLARVDRALLAERAPFHGTGF